MVLWFLMLILCSAATVAIAFPLIRHYEARDARAESAAVYQDQLKEVDRDLQVGSINEPEANLAKVEIERRLAAATRDIAPSRPLSPVWRNAALAAVVGIVIIGSVSLYAKLGHPMLPSADLEAQAAQQDQMAMILGMVRKQAEELKVNPKDMEGWIRLMRSLQVLNEPDKAQTALSFALKAFDGDATATKKLKAAASELNIKL
ncbi:MAG: c-type cytochrome biogenesis protein CcmI [Aestuariivirga sp.]